MPRLLLLRLGWIALLVVAWTMIAVWYGGQGRPLTAAEGESYLARIAALHADRAADLQHPEFQANLRALIAKDDGREFYMVNLERFRPGEAAREADDAYARIVLPLLIERGSIPMVASWREGAVLGAGSEQIDRVAVVRYRSLRDFLDMNTEPAMAEGAVHKFAALAHTEVFATRAQISSLHVRLTAALVLALLGVAGWSLIGRIARR